MPLKALLPELTEFLARYVRLLPDEGLFVLDAAGHILTWGADAERVTGFGAQEAVGGHLSLLYAPEDVALGTPQRELARAEREGRVDAEGWQVRRGGARIWVRSATAPLRDEAGRLLGFTRVQRDITEQLRAEQALRFSEAKFSGMIAIASDAIVSCDEEGRIILFNRGAEEAFGYAAAEVLGQPLNLLLPPAAREAHPREVAAFGAGERSARAMGRHRGEIRGLRRDGTEFPAEASINKLDLEGRRIYTAVLRDVTERQQAEQRIAALLQAEREARAEAEAASERARLLAEAGAVLGASLDYGTTLHAVAQLAVPRVADGCSIFMQEEGGLRRTEFVAAGVPAAAREALLARPPLEPGRPHPVWEVVRTGRSARYALDEALLRGMGEDEAQRAEWDALGLHDAVAAPIASPGGTMGALVFLARRGRSFGEAEVQLAEELGRRAGMAVENARLYREARDASRARDDMLHAVSHDLGNSLGAVMVSTAVLARTLPPEVPAAARERVEGIRALAEQMQRLRQDLLDAASVQAGQLRVHAERRDARELVERAASHFGPVAEERGLALRCDVGGEPGAVLADAERIHQVLGNLLSNAVKFTAAGGTVTVGAEPHPDGGVVFRVQDTGAGIEEADLPHVFDRFWRTRERNRLGTGLGLAISRGIVEAHGGRIWVESRRGEGSVFRFVLPGADGG